MVDTDSWRADARCKLHPQVDFFPKTGQNPASAIAVCMNCPVAKECYRDAEEHPTQSVGVWGGTTSRQRFRIRTGKESLPMWLR